MADPRIRRGLTVYGARGTRLGRVLRCDEWGFVIEKGVVFTADYAVKYDDVDAVTADGVHLRIQGATLVPEEEAEAWDPPRDPVGTAGGTDLEPLRAGMAELDEQPTRGAPGATGAGRGAAPRRGERRRPAAPGREVRLGGGSRPPARGAVAASGLAGAERGPAVAPEDIEKQIHDEIEDFEREGACGERGEAAAAEPEAPPPLAAAPPAEGAPRAGGPAAQVAAAREAARRPTPQRLDYRAAAPGAVAAMGRLEAYVRGCGLERSLLELVKIRASQVNGCAFCVDMHSREARRAGETEQRLYALPLWQETPFFTDRERAALAWTEAVTRLWPDHVADDAFQVARAHFSEAELVNLTMAIINIGGWNRLAIAFRVEPGSYRPVETQPTP